MLPVGLRPARHSTRMLGPMYPLERLINLLALLLESRRPLTFEDIRRTLPEAYTQQDKASAKRQFERDKDTLRQIGIPIAVVPTDAFEIEEGYLVQRDRYELPDISFTPEEAAALFVAAGGPEQDPQAAQAVRKLATTSGTPGSTGRCIEAIAPRCTWKPVSAVRASGAPA